ncbi:HNH endonuclease [Anaeromicrobium sediminis]|uniref:HNH nuclease domain-containing protein n=1 Tax=Anaeromicrobium sediminis TaxID=1478221 RepID=A0A267MMG5_9FIRM|nr:HNH endonuclease [Anaeromicrobium sediminis]PAB60003.1 hypothetical protein CCE28_06410 [Anaeromicrobium sediminis]
MWDKKSQRRYVYMRDEGICRFCGRKLLFKQVTLDHYLPKSRGGTNDIFNLACSCKKCNKYKRDEIPLDYKDSILELFKRAVIDGYITTSHMKMKKDELIELTDKVHRIEDMNKHIVFQSHTHRIYLKDNMIHKIVRVNTKG